MESDDETIYRVESTVISQYFPPTVSLMQFHGNPPVIWDPEFSNFHDNAYAYYLVSVLGDTKSFL